MFKKVIFFNSSTNIVGGGVKNSAIFISFALLDDRFVWYFSISLKIEQELKNMGVDTSSEYIHVFQNSPSRSKPDRKRLELLIDEINPDIVYTMAGPAYIKISKTHVMGISNPYLSHANLDSYLYGRNLKSFFRVLLLTVYQSFYARKANHWVFQTKESRKGFCSRLIIDSIKTTVVENAVDLGFQEFFQKSRIKSINLNEKVKIFCPAAAFKHKALHIIPNIAKEIKDLSKGEVDFSFYLTIDSSSELWSEMYSNCKSLGVCDNVETIGICNYFQMQKLYDNASIVFIPSILETFTATYFEAFISKTPLVVSDLDFSREICQDAAIYVNTFRYKEAALSFMRLFRDQDLQLSLIARGVIISKSKINQLQRYGKIINLLKSHI